MPRDATTLLDDLSRLIHAGIDHHSVSSLRRHVDELHAHGEDRAEAALRRTLDADPDETPLPLLDLTGEAFALRASLAEAPTIGGELEEIEEGGFWQTPMPAETLYLLVPETRPF